MDGVANVQVNRDYREEYIERLPDLRREPRGIQVWRPKRSDFAFFTAAPAS